MSLSMMITQTLVIITMMMRPVMMVSCDKEMIVMMQTRFGQCTAMYRQQYETALVQGDREMEVVTCELLDNMVTVCGEVWRQCHPAHQVENMRAGFVEKLILSNREATFNIEQCDSIQKYSNVQVQGQTSEENNECSEEEFQRSQQQFQNCTHSISSKLNDAVASLSEEVSLRDKLCQSISAINSECVEYLSLCSSPEDIAVLTKSGSEQLHQYLLKLVGQAEETDEDFDIDGCNDRNDDSIPDNIVTKNEVINEDYFNDETELEPVSSNLVNFSNETSETGETKPRMESSASPLNIASMILSFLATLVIFLDC